MTLRYLEGAAVVGAYASSEFELMSPEAIVECAPNGSDMDEFLGQPDADPALADHTADACRLAYRLNSCSPRGDKIHARMLGGPDHPLFSIPS